MKVGNCNKKALAADCPVCGSSNAPYEVNVSGFDGVFCRYECAGDGPCDACGGKGAETCEECEGAGKRPCKAIYAADGKQSSWEE